MLTRDLILGELQLDVPDYLKMEHDTEAKTATLSILNVDEKQQHEMWGAFFHHFPARTRRRYTDVWGLVQGHRGHT